MMSPYAMSPLNLNPLRDLLAAQIDFDCLRSSDLPKLFITATYVRTGKPKVFRRADLSADAIMASACLPLVFQAVEIDGEAYWDGCYMDNPSLFPLVDESDARDLIIVQIDPIQQQAGRTARDILERLNEITFNASLISDVRTITMIKNLIEAEGLDRKRYKDMRLHRIHAEQALEPLGAASKLSAQWQFLKNLLHIGWQANAAMPAREARISVPNSPIEVWVIPVDEAAEMASEAAVLLQATRYG